MVFFCVHLWIIGAESYDSDKEATCLMQTGAEGGL